MPTTEEDLQALRERNEQLRAEIANEESLTREAQVNLSNDVTAAQLLAEGAALENKLSQAKSDTERALNAVPASLQTAAEQMQAAVAAQKAQEDAAAAEVKAQEEAAAEAERQRVEAEATVAAEAAAAEAATKKGGN